MITEIDDHGNEYMIACINRSLNVHKKNYGSPLGEMLAAVWAFRTFTLVSDRQPLTYLFIKNDLVAMLAGWAITLQQYTFKMVHWQG